MQRTIRPEGLDLPAPQLQRDNSSYSDRTPSISGASLLPPPSVSPDPVYIAATAASQIVNSDRAERGQISPGESSRISETDTAVVSPAAVAILNAFLDQLLYSFLGSSSSTSITALRPAILEVLKPRLGHEAVSVADEELQGYLAGGEDEELSEFHSGQEFRGESNLSMVWKRTRLRCMVYTRLGDMEEEDEENYLEQEQGSGGSEGQRRLARDLGSVSPAAAIFLTSILEFIGEHALLVASEAACNRVYLNPSSPHGSRAVVEECDIGKLAFNPVLSRLWRSWKTKRTRSSSILSPRPGSHDLQRPRTASISGVDQPTRKPRVEGDLGSDYFNNSSKPLNSKNKKSNIASPATEREKAISLPDEPDFSDFSRETPSPEARRPNRDPLHDTTDHKRATSESNASRNIDTVDDGGRPGQQRKRSSSLPTKQTPYVSPIEETFITPNERPDPFVRDNDRSKAEKSMPRLTDDARIVPRSDDGNQAVSTMYDGAISQSNEIDQEPIDEERDRGISSYTKTSDYVKPYDHKLKPQALNLSKATGSSPKRPQNWQKSGQSSSSNTSLEDIHPLLRPKYSAQNLVKKVDGVKGPVYRTYDASIAGTPMGSHRQRNGNSPDSPMSQAKRIRPREEKGRTVKTNSPAPSKATTNDDSFYDSGNAESPRIKTQKERENKTPIKSKQLLEGSDQSIPQLSPLQETMDTAHDTSDETSSSAPSYDAPKSERFVPSHRSRGSGNESLTSSRPSQNRALANATNTADIRSYSSTSMTEPGVEKAAVQRVPSSTSNTRSLAGRTSTSSNRDGRPMTASSTTSQIPGKIKGMIGRDSSDAAWQPMLDRNSSEGSGSLVKAPNKEQDFEELMNSDQTVRYTLTPQNMREMETPDSQRYRDVARSDLPELTESPRDAKPTGSDLPRLSTSRSMTKLRGLNGLRSNPSNSPSPTSPRISPLENMKAPPRSVPKSPGPRPPGAIAHDPSLKSDSTRDIADFIRLTGPTSVPNPLLSNPTGPTSSPRPDSSSSSNAKGPPKRITKQQPVIVPKKSDAQLPKRTTSKLQARDPIVGNDNATADLASFLRGSPVVGQVDGNSPSQRSGTGAQLNASSNGLINGRTREAVNSGSSVASTQDSIAPSKITQSSTNSRTGLLDSSNRNTPTSAPPKNSNSQRAARNDEAPGPNRTQRRPRDPYALDSDDDEHQEGYGTPQPAREESLSDFLKNYHPPPDATNSRGSPPPISGPPKPSTKHTSPTIRERIARNIAVVPDYRPLPPKHSAKNNSSSRSPPTTANNTKIDEIRKSARNAEAVRRQNSYEGYSPPNQNNVARPGTGNTRTPSSSNTQTTTSGAAPPQLPPLNPRATSPHLISQNGTTNSSKLDPYYRPAASSAPPKRQMQAREEGSAVRGGGSGMSDLAHFLKVTEPPAAGGPGGGEGRPVSPVVAKEKERGAFGKIFGRR